jgi:tetratricopeptide (TPR) repeat protein
MGWSEQEDTQLKAYMAIARGDEARGIEDYEAALASYEDALQIYRHTGDQWGAANILLSLADLHADMEEYARALELYSEVVRFTISDLESRLYDLEHGLGEGLLQRAIAYLRRALRRDTPDWIIDLQARAFGGRAGVYWYSERYAQAIADYTRAIELKPDSFYAYSGRGQVRAEIGEYVKALEDLDRALGIGTEDSIAEAYARNGRGLACGGLRRYQEAFKEFDASIDRSPDNGWVYYNRAQVYERMEEFGKAREDYQTALEKSDPPLHALKREKAGARLRELESKGR